MIRLQQQEINKMCLRIVTPVNIADGITLGAKDYLYDADEQKIYFLNLHEWHKFIFTHNLLAKYEAYIRDFRNKSNLLTWLRGQGYGIDDVKKCITHEALAEVNVVDAREKQTLNDVNQHLQQPDGSLYVPGSSLKGVFRTAILYKLLQRKPAVARKYWGKVQEEMGKYNFKPSFLNRLTTDMEAELLHTLQLEDKGRAIKPSNAVCSALRGLQVSDSYASKNMQVAVLQKVDVGFTKEGRASEHTLSVFRECMLPGSEVYFDVKIDKAFMATLGINGIDDLLQATQEFFAAVVGLLKDAFGKTYPQVFTNINGANMFLGSNTGFLSKTLLALLAPDAKAAKEAIKVLLDKSFKQHKHMMRDKIISPRTLKCTTYKGEVVLMGLAEVRKA